MSSQLHKGVPQQSKPLNTLNNIPNQFVVTPTDKANVSVATDNANVTPTDKANVSVAFICQRFYAHF